MRRVLAFFHDTRHVMILLTLLVAGGAGLVAARQKLVPKSFGQLGPYRAAALDDIAALPSVVQADAVCLKCHVEVAEERAESLHKAVACMSCHGLGRKHVAQALRAAESPGASIDRAAKWDGNFLTSLDLYITKDQATCLVCHEAKVGVPKEFKQINIAAHLEEMGAESPKSRETCFECHGGHNTAP